MDVLKRVDELKVLTALAEAGLLSSVRAMRSPPNAPRTRPRSAAAARDADSLCPALSPPQAARAGVFSSLEQSGAFETVEKLLPVSTWHARAHAPLKHAAHSRACPACPPAHLPPSELTPRPRAAPSRRAVDKVKPLTLVQTLANIPAFVLFAGGVAILGAEVVLIGAVPDDNAGLIAAQAISAVLAGGAAVTLVGASWAFSKLQGDN